MIDALINVNLTINQGEFIVLCGQNGGGKSTLAKMLNGLFLPTEGEALVYGMDTKDEKKIFDIRARVGMVFQNPDNQMIASIVEDDIAFGPENLGIPREEIIERVDWALQAVGMSEYRKGTPFKMSGGQKQRIAIAAVLAMRPSVLVLDESTAMLDPKGRQEVLSVVKHLNKSENMTIILITHNMEEAVDADRVIIMHEGRFAADGTPEHIFSDEETLVKYGMDMPVYSAAQSELKRLGLTVEGYVRNEKELIDKLCPLL
jgi:energy-coupling factor transporter ATPase